MQLLPWLTRDPAKQAFYRHDPYVRIALGELEALQPDMQIVANRAGILFKPDAVARRLVEPALALLAGHGFAPIAAKTVVLDGPRSQALWWYQWNRASVDRLRLAELFGCRSPSLLVMLEAPSAELPATVRLSALKGPADHDRRRPDQLRAVMGMRNRMLSLVHCPDEPADLVRDLAILLPPAERPAFWQTLLGRGGAGSDPVWLAQALYTAYPAHALDPNEVRRRRGLEQVGASAPMALERFAAEFGPVGPSDQWDFITLAAEVIEHHVSGVEPLLSSMNFEPLAAAWRRPTDLR